MAAGARRGGAPPNCRAEVEEVWAARRPRPAHRAAALRLMAGQPVSAVENFAFSDVL